MRELKFRAWTGAKMIFGSLSDFIWSMGHQCAEDVSLEEEVGDELSAFQHKETEETIMQYTGMNDKEGKEIYEDDIVEITNNYNGDQDIGVIKFEEAEFVVFVDMGAGVSYTPNIYSTDIGQINVIGNIYQNPEFIK